MSKMINLNTEPDSDQFVKSLDGKEIVVYEDISGSKIYAQFNGERFIIKPRSLKNEELNFVDLAVQKFYNKAYAFFHTLPSYVTDILNRNWAFCFEYIQDTKPDQIEYNRIPKNNLILVSIVKGGKHVFNYDELVEYAHLFDVDPISLIFKGKLTSKQLEVINLYLKTSEEDLKFIFGEDNFTKFFYSILNPNVSNSFLMDADKFNDNLEKIIIRIEDDNKYTFEILNPLYTRGKEDNNTEYSQLFSLIIINFLEFLQVKKIKEYKPKGLTKDEMYINLISLLFNDYMLNVKDDIENWEMTVPEFVKDDKYRLNTNLIRNKDTQKFVKSNEKIEYVFKVILGTFNKKRKKPIGIMTEKTVELLNAMVDTIDKHLEKILDINREYRFQSIDLLNFGQYFDMKFDRDGADEIYPDVSVPFDEEPKGGEKKKGKKGAYTTVKTKGKGKGKSSPSSDTGINGTNNIMS